MRTENTNRRARRGRARVSAVLAAATAMAVAVQAAGADPAAACVQYSSDCLGEVVISAPRYDPPAPETPGSSNESGPAPITERFAHLSPALLAPVTEAHTALEALADCEALILGPNPPFLYYIGGKLFVPGTYVLRTTNFVEHPDWGMRATATGPTTVYAEMTTRNGGIGDTVVIYRSFETLHHDPGYYPGKTLYREPTPLEVKTMVVLHELAHATGALPGHAPGDHGGSFNLRIMEKCLGF